MVITLMITCWTIIVMQISTQQTVHLVARVKQRLLLLRGIVETWILRQLVKEVSINRYSNSILYSIISVDNFYSNLFINSIRITHTINLESSYAIAFNYRKTNVYRISMSLFCLSYNLVYLLYFCSSWDRS